MSVEQVLQRFSSLRILIVGDFLLDEYVFGDISRVSREAPVLILRFQDSDLRPGGAANAAANVHSLGAQAIPLGYIGDDEWGKRLLDTWPSGIDTRYILPISEVRTTRKSRILAGSFQSFRQQVVRLDYEHPFHLYRQREERILDSLQELVPGSDAVILSDYSLGNLTPAIRRSAIELAERHDKPITVDSRDDPGGFRGATTVTPNVSELERTLGLDLGQGDALLEQHGQRLRQEWDLQTLLITRGRLGVTLIEEDRAVHIPVFGSDQVADVTGAGDTVAAAYATALAAGASSELAARLANCAGGIVVGKRGTSTIVCEELRQAARLAGI